MFKKLAVSFALVGLAIASAAQHRITLYEESVVNGTTLRPGDYKLVIEGDKATLSRGKQKVEAAVAVQKSDAKYPATSVRYAAGNGVQRVQEIRVGGTDTKVVFDPASAAAGGR
jgi:hypothetical protein